MSVARYRDRHSVAGRKSDHGDSFVLASVLRTDMDMHRPLPADSELAQAIAVLARAQQDAVWDRTTAHNKLRSHLREYYPGFLAAFASARDGIMRPEARVILAAAPTPAAAAQLTAAQLRGLLKKAGRSRGIDTRRSTVQAGLLLPLGYGAKRKRPGPNLPVQREPDLPPRPPDEAEPPLERPAASGRVHPVDRAIGTAVHHRADPVPRVGVRRSRFA